MKTLDFYGRVFPVWKANFHAHSTNSDGKLSPEELIAAYRGKGYDILNFSDHRKCNPVSEYDGKGMTLLSGMELHPEAPRGLGWHLLAIGVPEDFANCSELPAQQVIDRVDASGGVVFIAHPYWCGLTSAELLTLRGYLGIEVYNSTCDNTGRSDSSQTWDELLDFGLHCDALGVDDIHSLEMCGLGWTMIAADSASPAAVLEALRRGRFYSSCGPEFTRLAFDGKVFEAEFTPCRDVAVYAPLCHGLRQYASGDGLLTRVRYDISDLRPGAYLRCRITDDRGRSAWSNPVYRA